MDAPALEALVRRCQQTLPDDTRAFEQLVALYKDRVFAVAYRLMGNRDDAEDQAQEAFLKVYRGIKNLDDPATLTTWIYRVTTHTCFDALDKQKRRPQTAPLAPPDADGNEEPRYAEMRAPTPEDAILRREVRVCLEQTFAQLEATVRTIIVLRDIEDRSYQEIAETLSLGLSAVKMRIHRARLAFQQALDTVCPGLRRDEAPHRVEPVTRT
jgi:RNA polymerase sigma-70 factor (ECF subfamily)